LFFQRITKELGTEGIKLSELSEDDKFVFSEEESTKTNYANKIIE
jgi:hypothetical protein